MGLLEEVQNLRNTGASEEYITQTLQKRGYQSTEISNALSQNKIRDAVNSTDQQMTQEENNSENMQPSVINSTSPSTQEYQENYNYQAENQQYPQQNYDYSNQQNYSSYAGTSADTVSEIAEQVASEKISSLRAQLEKIIDFRTTVEAKIESIDERLKRVEQIIDRLQLSVLQKVGDYMTNVEDIKKELQETQKTFKAMTKPQK